MSPKTGKSKNPAHPDAHPTAPGGMSEKALVSELTDTHGWTKADAKALRWPEKIDAVCTERRNRELEAAPTPEPGDIEDILAEFEDAEEQEREPEIEAVADIAAPYDEREDAGFDGLHPDDDGVLDPEQMFAEMVAAREAEQATQPPPIFLGIPGVKDYIFDGHAGAGPSGAERWMNCTMSLTASREFLKTLTPRQQAEQGKGHTAARQGTTAHSVAEAEANLVLGRTTQDEVDYTLLELSVLPEDEGEAFDEEMAEYVNEYVDLIRTYAQDRGDEHVLIEQVVEAVIPLTDMHEGEVYVIRGSADCIVLPTKTETELVVGDLKYGNGIDVDVDENPQIRLYALGVLGLLVDDDGEFITTVEKITYHIIQPRLGGIKTWTESVDDLLEWRDETLAPALTKALYGADEGATYEPSELACQWCPARGTCPALTKQRMDAAGDLFDAVVEAEYNDGPGAFPETTSLSDEALGKFLAQIAGLVDLHSDLKAEAQRRLHRGTSVPGFQLVSYTPPRKWKAGAAEALNGVPVWKEPVPVTPTQALKLLKEDTANLALVESLIEAPPKRPVIAPEGDRRKPWEGTPPEQMFEDESGTDEVGS